MGDFTIYPAIDLRHGRVVRLRQGDPQQQTVFGEDPAATGRHWLSQGATWLHVVNLDGAFDDAGAANWQLLPTLTKLGGLVQFGGGIRRLADMERAFDLGVSRVIVGTMAVEQPAQVAAAVARFGPGRVAVGLDAREGILRTHGWQTAAPLRALDLGRRVRAMGVQMVIHTDIGRDGDLTGVNYEAAADLATATGLQVIASGGVASPADVEKVRAAGLSGVIIGRALYEGRFALKDIVRSG